jgi:hypothetical protein
MPKHREWYIEVPPSVIFMSVLVAQATQTGDKKKHNLKMI